jgi:O-antigen/teichoic acid export membrane protein
MYKFIKIYFWQAVSIILNFTAIFIVTPFISSNQNLYGIYTLVISAYLFISYADFGFLSAGVKYASECVAQSKVKEEIRIIGFTGFIFFSLSLLYSLFIFFISFNPTILISELKSYEDINIAKMLFRILAITCPLFVCQRIIQIIFSIRIKDYIFQQVLICSNLLKLVSTFYFFTSGKYMIVEYFLFSQFCQALAVLFGLILLKRKLNYNLSALISAFRFSLEMYDKTKKLAFTSIYLTICWILYYELDSFAIAKFYGIKALSYYAIGLTIITYFRSFFGIIFTPFIARFNYFVGSGDLNGLKLFFKKVVILLFPVTLFPVVIIYMTSENFILTWVGTQYNNSIFTASLLVMSYLFSFISYPASILIMANERVKLLYITSSLQPFIFWFGILLTKNILGVESFAYFKLLAFTIESIVYAYIIFTYLKENLITIYFEIINPIILPLVFVVFSTLYFKQFLPRTHGNSELFQYFLFVIFFNIIGVCIYYFSSNVFNKNVKLLINQIPFLKSH